MCGHAKYHETRVFKCKAQCQVTVFGATHVV